MLESIRQYIKDYKDVILCYYTADEITAKNINCMLQGHDTLRQEFNDPDGAFFPYNNLAPSIYEVAKYLPVYVGDFYPIYKAEGLTRNPWAVSAAVKNAVKELPDTPIWFMPQGFGSFNDIYAMPTDSEIRLMNYSAVAAGAKGIIIYGLNGASSWMVKAGGEEIPIITSEGARLLPQWQALGECGKELTAIGPRLFYTNPELDYSGVKITCGNIIKESRNIKVYDGPALTISSLKHKNDKIRYLIVVNQDDSIVQKGTLSFSEESQKLNCYDLTQMKTVKVSENLEITLRPGDARFFILGAQSDIGPEIEDIFNNRYQREKARYIISSERAIKNGIEADPIPVGTGEKAYKAVIAAQQKLQKMLDKTEFGKMLEQREKARELLSEVDFILKKHLDLIVPPKVRAESPNFRAFPNPADPKLSSLVERIKQDFFDFWKFDRAVEEGKYKENQKQIQELFERISIDSNEILKYMTGKDK